MNVEKNEIEERVYQAVCELIHENGRSLGMDAWRKVFDEALANSFGSGAVESGD